MTSLFLVSVIITPVALMFSAFIIFTFLKFSALRTRSFELVFMLALSDFFANLSYIINPHPVNGDEILCKCQGALLQFFSLATVGWTLTIAVTLDLLVVERKEAPSFAFCNCVVWGIAALSAALPFSTNEYGEIDERPWCWIYHKDSVQSSVWQFSVSYLPTGASMVVLIILYYRVYRTVKRYLTLGGTNPKLLRLVRALKWYPIVFVVSWIPQAFIWFLFTYGVHKYEYTVNLLNVCLRGTFLQAIGHSIVYGMNSTVIEQWHGYFDELSVSQSGPVRFIAKTYSFLKLDSPANVLRDTIDDMNIAAALNPQQGDSESPFRENTDVNNTMNPAFEMKTSSTNM
jgi:hypothetical protein